MGATAKTLSFKCNALCFSFNERGEQVHTRAHAMIAGNIPLYDAAELQRTATLRKPGPGNWQAQVRRKGRYLSETFRRHRDAEEWALEMERRIDRGETPKGRREDIVAEAQRHPLMNDLWEDKIVRFDKVTVPAYVVASYSTPCTRRGKAVFVGTPRAVHDS